MKNYALIAAAIAFLLPLSCKKVIPVREANPTPLYSEGQPESVLFNKDNGFYLNKMLSASLKSGSLKIRNVLPHTFRGIQVFLHRQQSGKEDLLTELDALEGISEYTIPLRPEALDKQLKFNPQEMKKEDYFVIKLKVSDPLFEKISQIKNTTYISFAKRGQGNWTATTPGYIRAYLPILANAAYVFSSQKYEETLIKYPYLLYNFKGNNTMDTIKIDKNALYKKILAFPWLEIGVTTGIADGLGGGYIFGIHHRFLTGNQFYAQEQFPKQAYCHEFGHCLGYGHEGNMTYPKTIKVNGVDKTVGFVLPFSIVYDELLKEGALPFNKRP